MLAPGSDTSGPFQSSTFRNFPDSRRAGPEPRSGPPAHRQRGAGPGLFRGAAVVRLRRQSGLPRPFGGLKREFGSRGGSVRPRAWPNHFPAWGPGLTAAATRRMRPKGPTCASPGRRPGDSVARMAGSPEGAKRGVARRLVAPRWGWGRMVGPVTQAVGLGWRRLPLWGTGGERRAPSGARVVSRREAVVRLRKWLATSYNAFATLDSHR